MFSFFQSNYFLICIRLRICWKFVMVLCLTLFSFVGYLAKRIYCSGRSRTSIVFMILITIKSSPSRIVLGGQILQKFESGCLNLNRTSLYFRTFELFEFFVHWPYRTIFSSCDNILSGWLDFSVLIGIFKHI